MIIWEEFLGNSKIGLSDATIRGDTLQPCNNQHLSDALWFTRTFVGYIYVFAKMVKQCHAYMQGGKMYEMIIHRKSDSLISYLLQSTLSGTINLEFVLLL